MNQEEKTEGHYYWVVSSLQGMVSPEERIPSLELDEIDQIRKMVEEVCIEPPQFFTST